MKSSQTFLVNETSFAKPNRLREIHAAIVKSRDFGNSKQQQQQQQQLYCTQLQIKLDEQK